MGFYAPAQLVRDAGEHGVPVRPVDVNHSGWDCTLEEDTGGTGGRCARSGGFRRLMPRPSRPRAASAAHPRPFADPADLGCRAALPVAALERLARADAFGSTGRKALWAVRALGPEPLPLFATARAGPIRTRRSPP